MQPPPNEMLPLPPEPRSRADREGAAPMSLLSAVNAVLRHRWMILMSGVLMTVATIAVTLLQPRTYTATSTFVPQTTSPAVTGLTSVASQLGLNVGEGNSTESPAFYADLLLTREVLGTVADAKFVVPSGAATREATLAEIVGIRNTPPALQRHRVLEYLRRRIGASVTPKTGAVVLTVTTRWPGVSHQIAEHMLTQVSAFNLERRQSRAVAERQFTEQRLAEARQALAAAERRLESFLVANRRLGSPTLEFERDRLARDVSLRQQLYLTLSEAYERSRIDEVRDTPVITVVEHPELPAVPNRRLLALKAFVGLIIGLLLGVLQSLLRHALAATRRSRADEYAEFDALRREAVADLVQPWRPLTRRSSRGIAAS